MNKNREKVLSHPLVILLISAMSLLLCFSLYQSRQKAKISERSLHALEGNVYLSEQKVEIDRQKLEIQSQEIFQKKLIRDQLLRKEGDETTLQIPQNNSLPEKLEEKEVSGPMAEWKKLFGL